MSNEQGQHVLSRLRDAVTKGEPLKASDEEFAALVAYACQLEDNGKRAPTETGTDTKPIVQGAENSGAGLIPASSTKPGSEYLAK